MRISEYDRFGPWVYEINDKEDIPRLFIPYYSEIKDAFLLLKIPRNIERRNANPRMDLYDYLLGVNDKYLSILKRNSESVDVINVKFADIIAIKNSTNLLLGIITFSLPEKIISVNYNEVSSDLIQKLLKTIRGKCTGNNNFISNGPSDYNEMEGIDDLYINFLNSFAKGEDQFRAVAFQPLIKAIPTNVSVIGKLKERFNIFRENLLQNTMYLTNEKELLIITRGKAFRRGKSPLSYDFTYIPFNRITEFRRVSSNYENISPFNIETEYHTFQYYFDNLNDQKEILLRILSVS
jgi:hypothetical protein